MALPTIRCPATESRKAARIRLKARPCSQTCTERLSSSTTEMARSISTNGSIYDSSASLIASHRFPACKRASIRQPRCLGFHGSAPVFSQRQFSLDGLVALVRAWCLSKCSSASLVQYLSSGPSGPDSVILPMRWSYSTCSMSRTAPVCAEVVRAA